MVCTLNSTYPSFGLHGGVRTEERYLLERTSLYPNHEIEIHSSRQSSKNKPNRGNLMMLFYDNTLIWKEYYSEKKIGRRISIFF